MFTRDALRSGAVVLGCAALIVVLCGCPGTPTVISTAPADGATNVPVNGNIAATFSLAMDPATITTTTFTLTRGTTPVSGTVTYAGVTAVFNPTTDLAPNTLYTATITTGATALDQMRKRTGDGGERTWNDQHVWFTAALVAALLFAGGDSGAGGPLAEDFVWTFTTGPGADITAPTVSSTNPADEASGVSLAGNLAATFSEAMDPLTIGTATFTLDRGITAVSGTVTYAGVTATFNPTSGLSPSTVYTATITTGAADLAGNALEADFVWTFTTGAAPDTTAPTVSSTNPADGTTGVPLGGNLAATFSEAMDPLTIGTATFTLDEVGEGITPVPGTVTYAGVTGIFNPTSDLAPNTDYTATITTGAADLAGNALAADFVWTFTTGAAPDTIAPTVSSTVPADGAIGVLLGRDLAATFSEAMDALTITTATFTLRQGTTPVLGTVTYAGVTATFTPVGDLAPNTEYTATITNGAADLSGNALAADFVWTFTTGAIPDTAAPTVSSTNPTDGTAGVPIGGNLAATFSEAMNPLTITTVTFTLEQGITPVSGTVTYAGVTAVFNPASDLAPNTEYTATISTGAADLAGNALTEDFVWTFTTGAAPDTIAPTVSSTVPADGAIGVLLGRDLAATFSEAMDALTISTATFTLRQGTTPVLGTVTYAGVTATFTPVGDLAPNTEYTATITNGAADLSGNALAADFVWTFTTGAIPDTAAPTVSSTIPANASTNVLLGRNLAATFSEAMNPLTTTTVTFTLEQGITPISGTVTYAGVTAVFNPASDLAPNTEYTATISTGAADLAGNALTEDFVWTFTTGAIPDTTAPAVSSTDPADGAIGVPVNKRIAATFSEAMDPLTIATTTFALNDGVTPVPGTVTYAGVTATFIPVDDLAPNTTYTAAVLLEATDLAGNPMASDYVWSFTTGAAADTAGPMVSSTDPADGATDVPLNKRVAAAFSEAMDSLSIATTTFTLDDGITSVPGTVTYAGVTATFTPVDDLAPNTTYTAAVLMEVTDLAGNPMASDYVWSFTTGAVPDTTAPTVISTEPLDGAIDVPVNVMIAATFSEGMDPLTIATTTVTLEDGVTSIQGTVTYAGVTATFNPVDDLAPDTTYTATVLMEATDLAGNPMASDYVWTFTTSAALDAIAPTVISTDPVEGAIGVPINKKISATFSEAMDPLTITTVTFTLDQGITPILGTVTYAGVTAVFTPAGNLTASTEYTATITIGAMDLAGNPMETDYVLTFTTGVTTGQDRIDLGSANSFAILAGSTITVTGISTTVNGDAGVSPGSAVVGFPPGTLNGSLFTGVGSAAGQAKLDLTTAFNEAAGRSVGPVSLPGNLSGLTLYPGLYTNSTSVMLSAGTVTLDAQGDANAVFIFQMGSTLTTGSGTEVILSGLANPDNIYWQVGSSATLGTTSIFKGNILAQEAITLTTGSTLDGRALTQTAAVTLDAATITVPAP